MKKWADYLISEVSYNSEHLISIATQHQDTDSGITRGEPVDRLKIASNMKNGFVYITIYSGKNSWKPGTKLKTFSIGGSPYLRIDENKVKLDYLGDLPESSFAEKLPQELELQPEPIAEPEPPSSPRGSLPKESAEKLPQELELQPEPIAEPEPPSSPRGSLPKESAEKLPQELELQPEPIAEPEPPSSPRGSLPKESAEKLPQELELQPESDEEESTSEQLSQINDLQQQIDDLENVLSNQKFHESDEEESTPEQLSKVKKLEKEIEKLDRANIEHEIIQTLRKQNKKLDDIENKLHNLKNINIKTPKSSY